MRERPVRAQLYEANVRFGIEDRDWFVIAAVVLLPFIFFFAIDTFFFPIRVWRLPVYILTTPTCLIGSVAFFRMIHIDKPQRWFEDHVQAFIEAPLHRAPHPDEYEIGSWIIDAHLEELTRFAPGQENLSPVERLIRG